MPNVKQLLSVFLESITLGNIFMIQLMPIRLMETALAIIIFLKLYFGPTAKFFGKNYHIALLPCWTCQLVKLSCVCKIFIHLPKSFYANYFTKKPGAEMVFRVLKGSKCKLSLSCSN